MKTYLAFLKRFLNAHFFALLVLLLINFRYDVPFRPRTHGDTGSYIKHSHSSIFDANFYVGKTTFYLGLDSRPFVIPLIYKFLRADFQWIIIGQKLISCLSVWFLVSALLLLLGNKWVKYALIALFYAVFSWWSFRGWNGVILSESITMSFVLLWMGSLIYLFEKRSNLWLSIYLIITILLCFTRDTFMFSVLAISGLMVVFAYLYHRLFFRKSLILLVICIPLYLVQSYSAQNGRRHLIPLLNNIFNRILPVEDYKQWFIVHGMPYKTSLDEWKSKTSFDYKIQELYQGQQQKEFIAWATTEGKNVYLKFLLTHPKYTFTSIYRDNSKIFDCRFEYFTGEGTSWISRCLDKIFPLFKMWIAVALSLISLFFLLKTKEHRYAYPIILLFISLLNAAMGYHGDPFEVGRHCFYSSITMILTCGLNLALLLEQIIQFLHNKQVI